MSPPLGRRLFAASFLSSTLLPPVNAAQAEASPLAAIERRMGGRLGVFALDMRSGRTLGWRADERFLMCSTFKMPLASLVLARRDGGADRLDTLLPYGPSDLLGHAPVTRAHLKEGRLSLSALCAAAVEDSDNGAANLLLHHVGGPGALTRFVRGLGDDTTRFDRLELALNQPDGLRDTTTPHAMTRLWETLLTGGALSPDSRAHLSGWLQAATTGLERLRGGFPSSWRAGDKTGTSKARSNDVAVAWPRDGGGAMIVAAFAEGDASAAPRREAALRDVGRLVVAWSAR